MEGRENAYLCGVHSTILLNHQVIHIALLFVMISEFDMTWKSNL